MGTEDKEDRVNKIIGKIEERKNVTRDFAELKLHKLVCKGKCDWYREREPAERFNKDDLTEEEEQEIKEIVKGVTDSEFNETVRKDIHAVLCHPI